MRECGIPNRNSRWKILADEPLTKFELYHLGRDPQEKTELSALEPAKFAEMKRELIKLNTEIEAEGPSWWKTYSQGGGGAKKEKAKKK